MPSFPLLLLIAFALSEAASLGGLWLGERLIGRPLLRELGARSHASKMRSLDRVWPLTRIRPALREGNGGTVTVILTALIVLKSLGSMLLGLLTVLWLPLSSVTVPTIVAAEDPDDPALRRWVRGVARLQVTSHVLAAAVGFAATVAGPLSGRPVGAVVGGNGGLVTAVLVLSAGFAVAAGHREASGLAKRGI